MRFAMQVMMLHPFAVVRQRTARLPIAPKDLEHRRRPLQVSCPLRGSRAAAAPNDGLPAPPPFSASDLQGQDPLVSNSDDVLLLSVCDKTRTAQATGKPQPPRKVSQTRARTSITSHPRPRTPSSWLGG